MIKKFGDYLKEDLTGALVEPKSNASAEAKRLGLKYVGFGRYEDQTGQISHIVQNDRLIPFSKAIRSKSFQDMSADDFGDYTNNMKPELQQLNGVLVNAYAPENYDDDELDAIKEFTAGAYADINLKLSSLPSGIPAEQIQPEYAGDKRPEMIAALDSATSKVSAPMNFTTYVSLSSDFDITSLVPDGMIRLKGFRSSTVDPSMALQSGDPYMLQINVKKGSPGAYLDDYSSMPGEGEFLMPRDSVIKVVSGPSRLTGSYAVTQEASKQVTIFKCEVVN